MKDFSQQNFMEKRKREEREGEKENREDIYVVEGEKEQRKIKGNIEKAKKNEIYRIYLIFDGLSLSM